MSNKMEDGGFPRLDKAADDRQRLTNAKTVAAGSDLAREVDRGGAKAEPTKRRVPLQWAGSAVRDWR
ncbi:hypothetical protein ACOMHN_006185 [Nucella lapillus]